MTWKAGPMLDLDEHGRIVVSGYTVAEVEGGYQAVALAPLTDAEVELGCRDVIEDVSLAELLLRVAAEAIKRDMIARCGRDGYAAGA